MEKSRGIKDCGDFFDIITNLVCILTILTNVFVEIGV